MVDGSLDSGILNQIARDAWSDTIRAAEAFNAPGRFTTFVAYEFTSSTDDRGNLHRNIIFQGPIAFPPYLFHVFTVKIQKAYGIGWMASDKTESKH